MYAVETIRLATQKPAAAVERPRSG